MVYELLGFNPSWSSWISAVGVASYIDGMTDLYERAAAKWFSLPKVLSGFVRFAQHTAASRLAIKAIPWIAAAVRHDYDWRYGTEENLIDFLSTCWQRDAKRRSPITRRSEPPSFRPSKSWWRAAATRR